MLASGGRSVTPMTPSLDLCRSELAGASSSGKLSKLPTLVKLATLIRFFPLPE